jgi:predicted kinase
MLKGLPASGKSTWAKQKAASEPDTIIVNRDSIRAMLKGEYKLFPFNSPMEDLVTIIEQDMVNAALDQGYSVVVDATNFRNEFMWRSCCSTLNYDAEFILVDFTHVPLEECIKRDSKREFPVGSEIIKRMYEKYLVHK